MPVIPHPFVTNPLPCLSFRTHSAALRAGFDAESILANVLDSRLRWKNMGARLVRFLENEFLHKLGVVHPHYKEWEMPPVRVF